MKAVKYVVAIALCGLAFAFPPSSCIAQQVTGVLGAPNATTTIPGNQLPPPDPKFGGVIEEKASESKPWWPPRVVPPKGAPNVLLIMTDDVGFGAPGTFGGVVATPALDRIAKSGLRYTEFHSTSLCSPTRAALITGRNHHVAGFGVVGEAATGFPGYDSVIGKDVGTIGTILKENGYATAWFGKDHNTPFYQASQAGPFDQWPTGMGFDYFYGFVGGDTSQWQPNLFRNTTAIYPFQGHPGWNLTTAMADDAIRYMKQLKEIAPDKPFFVYYVPGGTHAPHHPTPEWIKRIGPELGAGKHTIVFDFKLDGPGLGKGGTGILSVDGKEVDKKHMEHTTPITFPEDEDFDVGMDTRTGVALLEYRYDCPFNFTGKVNKLTFDLGMPQYTEEERKKLPAIADAVAQAKD